MFTKASTKNHTIKYFKCNKIDHKIFEYDIKRIGQTLIKQINLDSKRKYML